MSEHNDNPKTPEPYTDDNGLTVRDTSDGPVLHGKQTCTAYLHVTGHDSEFDPTEFEDGTPVSEVEKAMEGYAATLLQNCSEVEHGWFVGEEEDS